MVQRLPVSPLLRVLAARPSRESGLLKPLEPCKSQSVFLGDESNDLTHNAVWLGKKSRLRPILRVAKVAQADANQAKPLVRSEADTL